MSDIADTILAQRLSQISGVGGFRCWAAQAGGAGSGRPGAARCLWHRDGGSAQRDRGRQRLRPKGSLDGAQQAYTIAANDQIAAAEAYKPIIIAYRNGSPVTIGDVAVIVDGLENDRTGGWYQGTPAVIIDISGNPAPT